MPAATTKPELLAVTETEYAKLLGVISNIPKPQAECARTDGCSIKDIIAHRAHWIQLFFGWYADGRAGRIVHFPAPGYKWSELKRYNADLRQKQARLTWGDARDLLGYQHDALMLMMSQLSEDQLYAAPMKGARNNWTTGRWAEATGASHYRSAAKWVRSCLKHDAAVTGADHFG